MTKPIIEIENLSKLYELGMIGATTLRDSVERWWCKTLGREEWCRKIDARHQMISPDDPQAGPKPNTIWVLKDVSFSVNQGEIIGIIGRNGAGKTTLLKILSRITEPTKGRAVIRGRTASLLEIGTGFHPELTGRENVYLNGAILGMRKSEIDKKFDEIAAFSEIEKFIDTPIKRYSSGMYVRLAFAVAAHLEPEILLVDEVLAVGDVTFQKKCIGKMKSVASEGRTVLFVSHNMGSIAALCNQCILLESGRVALLDSPSKTIASYYKVDDKRLTVKIGPHMRNKADGSINFRECSIMSVGGEPKKSFLIGEDIQIEVLLDSRFCGKISFWLIIFDSTGKPLLSSHQRDAELIDISNGMFKLVYRTKGLGLMTGDYTIAAGAFDANLKFLEWVDNCQTFEVLPCFLSGRAYDGRWGALNQPAVWRLESYG